MSGLWRQEQGILGAERGLLTGVGCLSENDMPSASDGSTLGEPTQRHCCNTRTIQETSGAQWGSKYLLYSLQLQPEHRTGHFSHFLIDLQSTVKINHWAVAVSPARGTSQ